MTTAARPRDFEASISIVGEKGIAQVGGIALKPKSMFGILLIVMIRRRSITTIDVEIPNGMGFGHLDYLNDLITYLRQSF